MFLKFETPYPTDLIVSRDEISAINHDRLHTRDGKTFHIRPISEGDLRRFGLVAISPLNGEWVR